MNNIYILGAANGFISLACQQRHLLLRAERKNAIVELKRPTSLQMSTLSLYSFYEAQL